MFKGLRESIRRYFDLQDSTMTSRAATESLAIDLSKENLHLRTLVTDLDHERALLQNKLANIKFQQQGLNKAVRRRNHKIDVHRGRLAELEHVVGELLDRVEGGHFELGSNTRASDLALYCARFKRLLRRVPPAAVAVAKAQAAD